MRKHVHGTIRGGSYFPPPYRPASCRQCPEPLRWFRKTYQRWARAFNNWLGERRLLLVNTPCSHKQGTQCDPNPRVTDTANFQPWKHQLRGSQLDNLDTRLALDLTSHASGLGPDVGLSAILPPALPPGGSRVRTKSGECEPSRLLAHNSRDWN